jgi:hypothetical protein
MLAMSASSTAPSGGTSPTPAGATPPPPPPPPPPPYHCATLEWDGHDWVMQYNYLILAELPDDEDGTTTSEVTEFSLDAGGLSEPVSASLHLSVSYSLKMT